jgi:hypothetical protein
MRGEQGEAGEVRGERGRGVGGARSLVICFQGITFRSKNINEGGCMADLSFSL